MNIFIRIICVFSLLLSSFKTGCFVASQNSTLQQLFIIFRHGDRAPITLYHTDPNPPSDFPDGLGELTEIGKSQHYELGQYLRNLYSSFLTDDPKEIRVNSSNVNRCLESVESHLAGLYPPKGRHVWNPNLDWQPIPIHTRLEMEDNVLTLDPPCPEYTKEYERILHSPEVQDYLKKRQPLFEYLTNYTGDKIDKLSAASYIFDTLEIEKRYGLDVPNWSTPIWNEMNDLRSYGFYISFSTPLSKRLRGGPILKDIIEKMEQKVKRESSLHAKVFMYSTHDSDLAALMSAMSVYNKIPPPYCATVLMELHEKGPHNHTVVIKYLNATTFPVDPKQPLYPLVVPGCEISCPLGHFIRITKDSVPDDWHRECGLDEEPAPFSPTALTIISTMGIILFLLLLSTAAMLWLRCQKEKSGVRYSRVPDDTMIN